MWADTSRTIEIEKSPFRLLAAIAVCLLFVALGAALAFGYLDRADSWSLFYGWASMVFFGLGAVRGIWRLLISTGPVVVIGPQGLRDTRVAAEFIPWPAVRGISTWAYRGHKVMVLAIDPAVEKRLTRTRMARWTRSANAAVGADGLGVAAAGLKIEYDTLLATSIAYARAHGGHA